MTPDQKKSLLIGIQVQTILVRAMHNARLMIEQTQAELIYTTGETVTYLEAAGFLDAWDECHTDRPVPKPEPGRIV